MVLHNLSAEPRTVRVDVEPPAGYDCLLDLLDDGGAAHALQAGRLELKLDGYGFRWFRLQPPGNRVAP